MIATNTTTVENLRLLSTVQKIRQNKMKGILDNSSNLVKSDKKVKFLLKNVPPYSYSPVAFYHLGLDDEANTFSLKYDSKKGLNKTKNLLREMYVYRLNKLTTNIEFKPKNETDFKILDEIAFNSLHIKVVENGSKITKENLWTLLNSDFAELYNPFDEYFAGLKAWDGIDYIQQLADTIETTNKDLWNICNANKGLKIHPNT